MANDFDTKKFIEAIRLRPPLWDRRDPQYRKLDLTLSLWHSIAEEMGGDISVNEVKQKWYNLRDCFRRELRHTKEGRKKKKWTYYNHMLFLTNAKGSSKKFIKNNDEITMVIRPVKNEADTDLINMESDRSDFNENINYGSVIQDVFTQTETLDNLTVTPEVSPEAEEIGRYSKISGNERFRIQNTQPVPGDNDDYHFAMSLIPYMRQVPIHKKLRMRINIFKIIAEESGFDCSSPSV